MICPQCQECLDGLRGKREGAYNGIGTFDPRFVSCQHTRDAEKAAHRNQQQAMNPDWTQQQLSPLPDPYTLLFAELRETQRRLDAAHKLILLIRDGLQEIEKWNVEDRLKALEEKVCPTCGDRCAAGQSEKGSK